MTTRKNSISQSSLQRGYLLLALALFGLLPTPKVFGVSPPPGGAYAGDNTAEGTNSLFELTSGLYNTATGFAALFNDSTGSSNAASGFAALYSNTTGGQNTAEGSRALFSNTTGVQNTANGCRALLSNTTGSQNTANGYSALSSNTNGGPNTATGFQALQDNTTGSNNTANGFQALFSNTTGLDNTATGDSALLNNTTGGTNTATGLAALSRNTIGNNNTATGVDALFSNTTGANNTALGIESGLSQTTGSDNIYIGNFSPTAGASSDVAGESDTIRIGWTNTTLEPDLQTSTYIAGIYGETNLTGPVPVYIDANRRLGTQTSSRRFKKEIKPMDNASNAILALKPVTFQYKNDDNNAPQFGLIAEEVEKVNPALIVKDSEGKPFSVRYEAVNAMLLNEFLKEHRRVEEQEATITQLKSTVAKQEATVAQQQKGMEILAASLKEHASQIQAVTQRLDGTPLLPLEVNNSQ